MGKTLDRELDEIAPMLLKKAGEVSTAGAHLLYVVCVPSMRSKSVCHRVFCVFKQQGKVMYRASHGYWGGAF